MTPENQDTFTAIQDVWRILMLAFFTYHFPNPPYPQKTSLMNLEIQVMWLNHFKPFN